MSRQFTQMIAPNKELLLKFLNDNVKCYVSTKIEIVTDNGHIVKFNERDTVAIVKLLSIDKDILFNRVFAWNIDRIGTIYTVILYI